MFRGVFLSLRAKADKSFADVLAHDNANPNVYDAIFNDNTQFQRTAATKSTSFDLRLDQDFITQYFKASSRREFMQSSVWSDPSVSLQQTHPTHARTLFGNFRSQKRNGHGCKSSNIENHGRNAQIPSIEFTARVRALFSPLEMLEKAKAYYEGNPRYKVFHRSLNAISSDYR